MFQLRPGTYMHTHAHATRADATAITIKRENGMRWDKLGFVLKKSFGLIHTGKRDKMRVSDGSCMYLSIYIDVLTDHTR